jgi:hypothetical protein
MKSKSQICTICIRNLADGTLLSIRSTLLSVFGQAALFPVPRLPDSVNDGWFTIVEPDLSQLKRVPANKGVILSPISIPKVTCLMVKESQQFQTRLCEKKLIKLNKHSTKDKKRKQI